MDPLTALGLASNIIQFVDFARTLFSTAHTLYVSESGSNSEHLELEELAQKLQQLAENANPSIFQNAGTLTIEEKNLKDLSCQCREVADELLSLLRSLKVKGDHTKWKSVFQAMRSIRKKSEIEALQLRLDRIGHQMGIRILINQQTKVFARLDSLAAMNDALETTRSEDINHLRDDFKNLFSHIDKGIDDEGAKTRAMIQLSLATEKGKEYYAEQRILEYLRFDTIDNRYIAIQPAHAETFRWMFDISPPKHHSKSQTGYVEWLQSDGSLYWISGKPGSGKSTLMKYLCEHPLSLNNLKVWAKGYQLITASFFFWNAGRVILQKSQEGLLRSMLYQILRQSPDLIPYASPSQWHTYTSKGLVNSEPSLNTMSVEELLNTFHRISNRLSTSSKIKFCFFIDGLDEYEGKPQDIIRLIELLRSSLHIKLCVSSRPLNEFEKYFGQTAAPKLYIHDLTRTDIEIYVRDTLEKDISYEELMERDDDDSLNLVQDIVGGANGVFLWVVLVVRELLEGLTNADRIADLQKRLQDIPPDLNEYFERILSTVDKFYRKQTSLLFKVTLAAGDTLPLMSYWFIDQGDSEFAINLEIQPLSHQKTNNRLKQMQKRLTACCKCLLETQYYDSNNPEDSSLSSSILFNWKVDFLHRTARDFLLIPETLNLLESWADPNLDVDAEICRALLAQIKTTPHEREYFTERGPVASLIKTFEYHISAMGRDAQLRPLQVSLLAELNRTLDCQEPTVGSTDKLSRPEIRQADIADQPSNDLAQVDGEESVRGMLSAIRIRLARYLA